MNNLRPLIIVAAIFFAFIQLDAQLLLTEYHASKVDGDKILIRWEPRSVDDWIVSKDVGYAVKMFRISKSGNEEYLGSQEVKPAPIKDWIKYEDTSSDFVAGFVEGARSFVYPDQGKGASQLSEIFDLKGDEAKENKVAMGFLLYTSSFDFEISKMSGLGFEIPAEDGYTYRFEVQTRGSEPISISVDPNTIQEPNVPKVIPEWGDREVEINWNGSAHQGAFLGYMISKSEDGVNYKNLTETPQTSNLGLLEETSPLLQMAFTDSLLQNDKTYWYKIQGFDYFGKISNDKKIISGQGYKSIQISPIIEYANQTEDNHAHLKWFLPEEMEKLVDRYRITRSDNDKGPYEIVIDSIVKTTNEIKLPIENTENYFRVEAVPYRGRPVGSISVFIMGQDTVPPAVPEIIGAFIDSLGNIEVKWKSNTEKDLWGYRVFRSNFDNQEYGLVSSTVSKDTIFRDSVDVNFNTAQVFYKIYATDIRDNRSVFTLPVRIEKPDIIPPGMASLGKLVQKNDSVAIYWVPSPSDDVVNHHIFRRKINDDYAWTLAGILDNSDVDEPFIDAGLDYGASYAYTIIAFDKAGLKSKAVQPKNITLIRKQQQFNPEIKLKHTINKEQKEITISWELKKPTQVEHVLVYRGKQKNKLGKYKIIKGDQQNLVELVSGGESMFYKIKPIYEGQQSDYYSDTIEVNLSKSE